MIHSLSCLIKIFVFQIKVTHSKRNAWKVEKKIIQKSSEERKKSESEEWMNLFLSKFIAKITFETNKKKEC